MRKISGKKSRIIEHKHFTAKSSSLWMWPWNTSSTSSVTTSYIHVFMTLKMSEIAFRGLKNLEICETTARGPNKIFAHFAPGRLGRKCSCLLLEMLFCGEGTGAWTKFRCSRRGVEKSHPGPRSPSEYTDENESRCSYFSRPGCSYHKR